jgi:hypothetical protein
MREGKNERERKRANTEMKQLEENKGQREGRAERGEWGIRTRANAESPKAARDGERTDAVRAGLVGAAGDGSSSSSTPSGTAEGNWGGDDRRMMYDCEDMIKVMIMMMMMMMTYYR